MLQGPTRALIPIIVATASALAHADPTPTQVIVVGRASPTSTWTDAPTEARVGDGAELAVVVVAKDRNHRVVLADDEVAPLVLAGHTVAARDRRAFPDGAAVRWSTVEPFAWHQPGEKPSNGSTEDYHSNVSTTPRDFGRWLGYDQLHYFATVVADFDAAPAARRRTAEITPHDTGAAAVKGAGTIFISATVRFSDNSELSAPGADDVNESGIARDVHRVSLRLGDDFLGYLSGYFLVPEVFGSAGGGMTNQTDRYVGADCADVMVGALRASGHRELEYTNVAGLPELGTRIAPPTEIGEDGKTAKPITGVQPGDLIRIDYGGIYAHATPRDWDHVAALWEDKSDPDGPFHGGPDGQLDGFDIVVHMGHPRLVIEPLANQAPATIDVWRWKPRFTSTKPAPARTSR
jgi:hypothetical protein